MRLAMLGGGVGGRGQLVPSRSAGDKKVLFHHLACSWLHPKTHQSTKFPHQWNTMLPYFQKCSYMKVYNR